MVENDPRNDIITNHHESYLPIPGSAVRSATNDAMKLGTNVSKYLLKFLPSTISIITAAKVILVLFMDF